MFSEKWGFSPEMSSPGNSKANGAAEAAVKIAKRLLRKCRTAHEDNIQRSPLRPSQPRTVPDETVSITPTKSPDKAQSPVKESTDITRVPSSPNVTQQYVTKTGRVVKPVRKLNL